MLQCISSVLRCLCRCDQCSYVAAWKVLYMLQCISSVLRYLCRCNQCSYAATWKVLYMLQCISSVLRYLCRCNQCSYAAAWKVQLKEHQKAHSLSTAVTCGQCGVLVRNSHTLAIHEKKEHSAPMSAHSTHPSHPSHHTLGSTSSGGHHTGTSRIHGDHDDDHDDVPRGSATVTSGLLCLQAVSGIPPHHPHEAFNLGQFSAAQSLPHTFQPRV